MKKHIFSVSKDEGFADYLEDIISKYIKLQESSLLEVGCGNGRFGAILGDRLGEYFGVDPNKDYIRIAKEHSPRIDYRVGSAESLPFERKFDLLFYPYSWHFITNFEKANNEAARVLEDVGIIFIREPKRIDSGWSSSVLNRGSPKFDEKALEKKYMDLDRGREAILDNPYFDVVEKITDKHTNYILKRRVIN